MRALLSGTNPHRDLPSKSLISAAMYLSID